METWLPELKRFKIAFIGEAPGKEEDFAGLPFVGAAGQELRRMVTEAGLNWKHCIRMNLLRFRPPGNKLEALCVNKSLLEGAASVEVYRNKYLHPALMPEIERLRLELLTFKPNLIVCLGAAPMAVLTGKVGIGKSRGAITESILVPGIKVLGTYHPANVLRQWKNRVICIADLMKAKRESQFKAIRRPHRKVLLEPTIREIETFAAKALTADLISFDIETVPSRKMITCIGFALDSVSAIVIPLVDKRKPGYSYWPDIKTEVQAWKLIKSICENPVPKLAQNGLYDMQWLWWHHIQVRNYQEDTMLLHHSLYPEMPKSLGFMGSIYTDEANWKLYAPRRYGKTSKLDDVS